MSRNMTARRALSEHRGNTCPRTTCPPTHTLRRVSPGRAGGNTGPMPRAVRSDAAWGRVRCRGRVWSDAAGGDGSDAPGGLRSDAAGGDGSDARGAGSGPMPRAGDGSDAAGRFRSDAAGGTGPMPRVGHRRSDAAGLDRSDAAVTAPGPGGQPPGALARRHLVRAAATGPMPAMRPRAGRAARMRRAREPAMSPGVLEATSGDERARGPGRARDHENRGRQADRWP